MTALDIADRLEMALKRINREASRGEFAYVFPDDTPVALSISYNGKTYSGFVILADIKGARDMLREQEDQLSSYRDFGQHVSIREAANG